MGGLFGGERLPERQNPTIEEEEEPTLTEDQKLAAARRRGRLALVNTSPQGVLSEARTGRRRLLS